MGGFGLSNPASEATSTLPFRMGSDGMVSDQGVKRLDFANGITTLPETATTTHSIQVHYSITSALPSSGEIIVPSPAPPCPSIHQAAISFRGLLQETRGVEAILGEQTPDGITFSVVARSMNASGSSCSTTCRLASTSALWIVETEGSLIL